jgi:predicted metal-dependent HD superfamily phosphohydrolase
MSMFGDIAKEGLTEFLYQKLVEKINKYPEAKRALCEIGLEMFDDYCSSTFIKNCYEIFKKGARPSQIKEKWEYMDKNEDWYRLDWNQLCQQLGVKDPDKASKIYRELFYLYEAPGRHYHNLFHVYMIVAENFQPIRHQLADRLAVHMAIWFHDAIYDTKASDNEEQSADLAKEKIKELGLPDAFGKKVSDLILTTKHLSKPKESDAQYLVDMDLAIFGQPEVIFNNYVGEMRLEYGWKSDADFAKDKKDLVERFLKRRLIYCTDFFQNKYEVQARKNLERSLEKL